MASETPRIDPREVAHSGCPVFRLIAQVKAQPTEKSLVLSSPTDGGEMITLSNVRVSLGRHFEPGSWHEFVCRSSDSGDVEFLVLDAVPCVLRENEEISVDGIVVLQKLSKNFPEIY